jgi:uncharacterized protein (DUF362 family)
VSTVFFGRTADSAEAQAAVFDRAFSELGLRPSAGENWIVKLNLTYPTPSAGVTTSLETVEGLALWGRDHGVRLELVESDGGNRSHRAVDALASCGFVDLAKRYGGSVRSLTDEPWREVDLSCGRHRFRLPLPPRLLDRGADRFVDLPVLKTHIFSTVTLGLKNLWGCIPDPLRMYHHHLLDRGLVGIAKALRPDLLVIDGRTALDGNGPINGKPVPARMMVVSDSLGAGDWEAAAAMGFDPASIRHLRNARDEGLVPADRRVVDPDGVRAGLPRFQVERTLYNWGSIVANFSPRLQKLVYHSPLSPYIYAAVSPFRRGTRAENVRRRFD